MRDVRTSVYKLNRLQGLAVTIQAELERLNSDVASSFGEHLKREFIHIYNDTSDVLTGGNYNGMDVDAGRLLAGQDWAKPNYYSESIWGTGKRLRDFLQKTYTDAFIIGKPYREIEGVMRKQFANRSSYEIKRLVRTEGTRIANEAMLHSAFRHVGVTEEDQYRIVDMEDSHVCNTCKYIVSQTFKFKDRTVGENFPPLHPNCRCAFEFVLPEETEISDEEADRVEAALLNDGISLIGNDGNLNIHDLAGEMAFSPSMMVELKQNPRIHLDYIYQQGTNLGKRTWLQFSDRLVLVDGNCQERTFSGNLKANYEAGVGVKLNISDVLKDTAQERAGKKFFHEFGHHIDYLCGGKDDFLSMTRAIKGKPSLGELIFDEVQEHLHKTVGDSYEEKIINLLAEMEADKNARPKTMLPISDLYGGASNNRLKFCGGHDDRYWMAKQNEQMRYSKTTASPRLGKEGFAEMFAAQFMPEEEREVFEKYLPKSYNYFKDLLIKIHKEGM